MADRYANTLGADARRPLFPMLMTFPATCFLGALVTDIAYARSFEMTWESFSIWLITAGMVVGGIAVAIGLFQAFVQHRWPTRVQMIGYAVVLILSLFNAFVHSRDAYTSVVPEGLTLSALVALVLLVMGVLGRRGFASRRTGATV
jgi:uncharacterized membrane protein